MNAYTATIPFRLRPDLAWVFYPHRTRSHWVANDPIEQEFYFLSDLERRVACCLDGNATVELILEKERGAVANGVLTGESVVQLITRLNQNSLLLPSAASTANQRKQQTSNSSSALQRVSKILGSVLALRIPIFNPSALLRITTPLGAALFRMSSFYIASSFAMIALIITFLNWHSIVQDATAFNSNLHGDRLWITLGLLFGIKLLHELGHGMACVRFGGKCNELGFILLFGTPSLYCDVTDSWKLSNRWQRIIIAAGGIYVEMILATLACFVWASSDSIGLRGIAVQVMIVCSLMTLLLNANPLLRYDGYYVLSDLVGIPNLGDESRKAWNTAWIYFFTYQQPSELRTIESQSGYLRWMITYHLLSMFYRCFLLVAIMFLAYTWLERNGMRSFADTLFYTTVILCSFVFLNKLRTGVQSLLQTGRVHWQRVSILSALFALAGWFIVFFPMPTWTIARGYLEPNNFSQLFAKRDAVFVQSATNGQQMLPGQKLFQLESFDLDLEILKTEGEVELAEVRVVQLQSRLTNDPDSAQQIIETEQKLSGLQRRLSELKTERTRLTVYAVTHGVFLDPLNQLGQRSFTAKSEFPRVDLRSKVLDRAPAERGELIGWTGDGDRWVVNALIAEHAIQKISIGSRALIRLDQHPEKTFEGSVKTISPESITHTPKALAGDSLFNSYKASGLGKAGLEAAGPETGGLETRPEETAYAVAIELDQVDIKVFAFGLASVKIEIESRTIANQLYDRFLSRFLVAR